MNPKNRWVVRAALLPLDLIEEIYRSKFSQDRGAPAINGRIAFCALFIKEELNVSDDETVAMIQENPYLQYFLGFQQYSYDPPFDSSMMTHFRKRFTQEDLALINEAMIKNFQQKTKKDDDSSGPDDLSHHPNQGKLIVDATCAPGDIKYPTDLDLLNKGREKLEAIIDKLHIPGEGKKPRTYRNKARKDYLSVAKNKRMRRKKLKKAVKKQLQYLRRNLGHIDKLVEQNGLESLTKREYRDLMVIHELYRQQYQMFSTGSHSIEGRIVSINQPHIRPIVRGKSSGNVEFGCKLSISLVDGFCWLDRLSWNSFNEGCILKEQIELYHKRHGYYPAEVHGDKIYRNRENRRYCKELGIKLSGPPLGRPSKNKENCDDLKEGDRNAVEGKFGEGKRKYSLGRIAGKLAETSESMVSMIIIVMNMNKMMREYCFGLIQKWMKIINIEWLYGLRSA